MWHFIVSGPETFNQLIKAPWVGNFSCCPHVLLRDAIIENIGQEESQKDDRLRSNPRVCPTRSEGKHWIYDQMNITNDFGKFLKMGNNIFFLHLGKKKYYL